jgi:hypothetical protein
MYVVRIVAFCTLIAVSGYITIYKNKNHRTVNSTEKIVWYGMGLLNLLLIALDRFLL